MMMGMMGMMGIWLLLGLVLCIVLVAAAIWLLTSWLHTKQASRMPYEAAPQDTSYPDARG
jgi:uncharacterized membrane protein